MSHTKNFSIVHAASSLDNQRLEDRDKDKHHKMESIGRRKFLCTCRAECREKSKVIKIALHIMPGVSYITSPKLSGCDCLNSKVLPRVFVCTCVCCVAAAPQDLDPVKNKTSYRLPQPPFTMLWNVGRGPQFLSSTLTFSPIIAFKFVFSTTAQAINTKRST